MMLACMQLRLPSPTASGRPFKHCYSIQTRLATVGSGRSPLPSRLAVSSRSASLHSTETTQAQKHSTPPRLPSTAVSGAHASDACSGCSREITRPLLTVKLTAANADANPVAMKSCRYECCIACWKKLLSRISKGQRACYWQRNTFHHESVAAHITTPRATRSFLGGK